MTPFWLWRNNDFDYITWPRKPCKDLYKNCSPPHQFGNSKPITGRFQWWNRFNSCYNQIYAWWYHALWDQRHSGATWYVRSIGVILPVLKPFRASWSHNAWYHHAWIFNFKLILVNKGGNGQWLRRYLCHRLSVSHEMCVSLPHDFLYGQRKSIGKVWLDFVRLWSCCQSEKTQIKTFTSLSNFEKEMPHHCDYCALLIGMLALMLSTMSDPHIPFFNFWSFTTYVKVGIHLQNSTTVWTKKRLHLLK